MLRYSEKISKKRIVLASASPRRRELLSAMDIEFSLLPDIQRIKYNETIPDSLAAKDVAEYLSKQKADFYFSEIDDRENRIIICADTVVILEDKILGKPHDLNEAAIMLKNLSGKTHIVTTGVTIRDIEKTVSFSDSTMVEFDNLSSEEIEYYISHYTPLDKAGAYGIQEWIGVNCIKRIEGSYHNVMGLPTQKLHCYLKEF